MCRGFQPSDFFHHWGRWGQLSSAEKSVTLEKAHFPIPLRTSDGKTSFLPSHLRSVAYVSFQVVLSNYNGTMLNWQPQIVQLVLSLKKRDSELISHKRLPSSNLLEFCLGMLPKNWLSQCVLWKSCHATELTKYCLVYRQVTRPSDLPVSFIKICVLSYPYWLKTCELFRASSWNTGKMLERKWQGSLAERLESVVLPPRWHLPNKRKRTF